MKTRIQKYGDGLAIMIPSAITDESGFSLDAEVDVTCENGAVIARPAPAVAKARFTLEELVSRITPENRHPETDTGPAVGQEVW